MISTFLSAIFFGMKEAHGGMTDLMMVPLMISARIANQVRKHFSNIVCLRVL